MQATLGGCGHGMYNIKIQVLRERGNILTIQPIILTLHAPLGSVHVVLWLSLLLKPKYKICMTPNSIFSTSLTIIFALVKKKKEKVKS